MSSDKLDKIWEMQFAQQIAFNMNPVSMNDVVKSQVAKDLILGLYEETSELAGKSSHYKAHILKSPRVEKGNVAEAAADVIKYAVCVAQLYGITANEMLEAFVRKSNVVADRARGERLALERDTDVVLVDIDNVIADLSEWQERLRGTLGTAPITDRTVSVLESLKDDFYRDGKFMDLQPIDGAADGLKKLADVGWKIVLISARPYWQYKRVYGDTLEWLQKHGMTHDLILFNKDKAEAIYEHIFPAKPVALIEDLEKHAKDVSAIGVPVLLLSWEYNAGVECGSLIRRVRDWQEIVEVVGKPIANR